MYRLKFATYSGMTYPICESVDRVDVRTAAAEQIRRARQNGDPIVILKRGEHWEFETPDSAATIGDRDGLMYIVRDMFECHECGSEYDERDLAYSCCEPCDDDDQRDEDEHIYQQELARQFR